MEPFELSRADFVPDRLARLVRQALEGGLISLSRANSCRPIVVDAMAVIDFVDTDPAIVNGLSFEDCTSLVLAHDNHWACLTNDRRLRSECRDWGKEDSLPTLGFSGRVLAEPAGKPKGSAQVGPPELNRRQYFLF